MSMTFRLNGIKFKNSKYDEEIKKIDENEFIEAIFRIARCNSSNDFEISDNDRKLREYLIKKHIFNSKYFNICRDWKTNNVDDGKCDKNLKEEVGKYDIFTNNVTKPYSLEDIIKLEYLNYLFNIIYRQILSEKYKNNSFFKRCEDAEYIFKESVNIFDFQHKVYYPNNFLKENIKKIIDNKREELEKYSISLVEIDISFIKNEILKSYHPVPYEANCCYSSFKNGYLKCVYDSNNEKLKEWVDLEIKRVIEKRTIAAKKPVKIYQYDRKMVKMKKQKNRRFHRGKMNKRLLMEIRRSKFL